MAQTKSGAGMVPASGVFVPSTIRGEAFHEGVAEIYALYDKAEAVDVLVDRLASGATVRPEVVAAAATVRAGGTLISIIGNSPLAMGDARRLTESLLEMMIPGAILSSKGVGVSRQSGIVSLVTLSQTDEGVRVLIHAMGPAVMRAGTDANRVVIDVDPVIAGSSSRQPVLVPAEASGSPPIRRDIPTLPAQNAAPVAPVAPAASASRMTDVDRLVRENRFPEALTVVDELISGNPSDASLRNLRRRLETLTNIMKQPAASAAPSQSMSTSTNPMMPVTPMVTMPPSPEVPVLPMMPQNQSLQPPSQAIQIPDKSVPAVVPSPVPPVAPTPLPGKPEASEDMVAMEAAVRAGKYREALTILDRHIAANPQDSTAARMRIRIEQMIKILDGQQ